MNTSSANTSSIRNGDRGPADGTVFQTKALSLGVLSVPMEPQTWPQAFTEAERDIARHLIRGRSYRAVAAARAASEHTVSKQVSSMLAKVDAASTAQMIALLASS